MKKIIIRFVGSLCLIASLFCIVFPAWIHIDGVSRKFFRQIRTETQVDLDGVYNALIATYEHYEKDYVENELEEDLEDCNLPDTPGKIRRRFRETEEILKELLDENISFKEAFAVISQMPGYIRDTENLLDTTLAVDIIFSASMNYYSSDIEDILYTVKECETVVYIAALTLVLILALGVASAITHSWGNLRFLKCIFAALLFVVVIVVCVGAPIGTEFVRDSFTLPRLAEDLQIRSTAMPFVALVLAITPIILDILFERNKKEEE